MLFSPSAQRSQMPMTVMPTLRSPTSSSALNATTAWWSWRPTWRPTLTAFLRRVTVSVDFPMPEEAERRAIWERSLPAGAPCQDLDVALLARLFKLSGGSIRNAALTAAFLAADRSGPVTMECVVEAVQLELRKLGRLVNPEEFGPYSSLVQGSGLPKGAM